MVKRILLSTAVLLGLATTSWAQCSTCGTNGGGYVDDIAYSQAYSQPAAAGGFGSRIRGIGQGIFSPVDTGCMKYKYARLFGGLGYVDDVGTEDGVTADFDDGWGAGASFGRRIGRRRLELETSYRHNSVDLVDGGAVLANGNLSTTAGMANATFDWVKIGRSTFYTGGGIGIIYGDAHLTSESTSVDDEAFAYQGIFGLDRDLRNGMRGFVEYRYLSAEFDFNDADFDYDAQNLFFGFEFRR